VQNWLDKEEDIKPVFRAKNLPLRRSSLQVFLKIILLSAFIVTYWCSIQPSEETVYIKAPSVGPDGKVVWLTEPCNIKKFRKVVR
jgi:hypothetical protein